MSTSSPGRAGAETDRKVITALASAGMSVGRLDAAGTDARHPPRNRKADRMTQHIAAAPAGRPRIADLARAAGRKLGDPRARRS